MRAGGLFFLQIFYRCPATDSDVSDVDKRPCIIDKSDVSTSLTHRRRPQQSTLFSSNTVTDTAAIFSRLKGRHLTGRTQSSTYLEATSVSNRHRHSSMHVDDIAVTTARACTMCACVHTKCFLWRHEKSLRSALQNAVDRVSRNRDLFQCGLKCFLYCRTIRKSRHSLRNGLESC